MNMDEEEPNCGICFEPFDDDTHSPRTLRCGHTLCTPCIEVLVKKSLPDRVCPECRKTLKISSSLHLPVSYTIMRLSRALAKAKPSNEVQIQVVDNNTCMNHGAPTISWCPLSDKWHCFKCIHADNCDSLLSVPEAFLHIKQNYSEIVGTKISYLSEHNEALVKESETLQQEILSSQKRIEENKLESEETKEWQKKLETDEAELVEAASMIKLTKAIKRLKRDVSEYDSWIEKLKPSVKCRMPRLISNPPSSLDFAKLAEKLLISQSMYVVQEREDFDTRWGQLSMDNHHLLMFSLEDDPPPKNSVVLQFQDVLDAMEMDCAKAFFDIGTDKCFEGRVYLEMFGNTPRSTQFLMLCTGEGGPCYKNNALKEFEEDHHRYMRTGHFISGEPLVEEVEDGGVYCKTLEPGMLNGWKSDDEHWALCDIVLECKAGFEDDFVFGKVSYGLSILKGVCTGKREKPEIAIVDCGVIVHSFEKE